MSISLSLWWLVLTPLAFFPPIYVLRRFRVGAWLSIGISLGLVSLALLLPRGELHHLLGRPFILDDISAYILALLFGSTAFLFILSLTIPQGWTFYPLSLVILTLFSTTLMTRHLGLIAMFINLAALLSVFVIQGGRLGSVRAALRFMTMMTLAVPIFLLAAWYLDRYHLYVNDVNFLKQITFLVSLGFALWLGVFPLHGWVSLIATEAKPGITAFILITFPTVAIGCLLHLLAAFPWLIDSTLTLNIVLKVGLVTAAVGGILASVQQAFGPLTGYACLFDLGLSLVAIGLGTHEGFVIILFSLTIRALALLLIALSQGVLQSYRGGDSFSEVRGLVSQAPMATLGIAVGGLTLTGLPFTAGFVSRWTLLQALVTFSPSWSVTVLLASLGVAIGYLRGLYALVETGLVGPEQALKRPPDAQTQTLDPLMIGFMILCCGLGLFPQSLLNLVQTLVASLNLPIL